MKQLVVINNNQIVVSSKDLAEHFGKEHKDVLENIRHILVAENSATKFFQETSTFYRGREFPFYLMNRDGFFTTCHGLYRKESITMEVKIYSSFQ